MRILFIFKSENFLAPIGICSISAIATMLGHHTFIVDISSQNPFEALEKIRPDMVAYSSSTGEAKHYLKLNEKIKERYPEIFSILGGPHPTFYMDVVERGKLDAICAGEGEHAFRDLLRVLESNGDIDNIPNIVTRNNVNRITLRNLEQNIDNFPFPDYKLIYDNLPMGKYPLKNFITSRGCPYKCTYCFNDKWNQVYRGKGDTVRRHSVDYVIEDIARVIKNWPLSNVKFYDDVFAYKADEWLEEFSRKYKKDINLPFFILTRADLLNENMIKLLKYAGCRTISMSIESGSPRIRNEVLKRNMSDNQIINAHKLCDKYGIYTFTNCMVGIPGSSIKDEFNSVNLVIKSKVTWSEFLILHPYPGTRLGDKLIEQDLYKPDYDKMHTSYMNRSPLKCFTEKEKNLQSNLSVLGAVAVVFPFLWKSIIKRMLFIRHNWLFTLLYYLVKMYIIRKKIYVTKTDFWNSLHIFRRSLKQEFFRHEFQDMWK